MADAVLFDIELETNGVTIKPVKKSSSFFESFIEKEIHNEVLEITLKWIDSLKFKDKIIKREPRIVTGWLFKNYKKLFVFSESESEINYFIVKAQAKYKFLINEKLLFEEFSKNFSSKKWRNTEIIAIDMKNEFNQEITINTSGRCFEIVHELNNIFTNNIEQILSLTFKLGEKYYFTMDRRSLISVPDNINQEERINLYKELVKNYV